MSRSRKDGRRRGGHVDKQVTEVWSRRCRKVSMWRTEGTLYKRITNRYERRQARRMEREAAHIAQLAARILREHGAALAWLAEQ